MGPVAQSVYRLATGWTVQGSNPGGGEIFRARPDRPWGPPSLLSNGYQVFPGGKAAGAWCWPPTPSSAEVKKGYSFTSIRPLGHFRPLTGLLHLLLPSTHLLCNCITTSLWPILFFWHNSPIVPGQPHCRDFTITPRHATLDWTSLDEWVRRKGFCVTTLHNRNPFPAEIRTRNPSNRAVTDPCLGPRGHWDRRRPILDRRYRRQINK
jgi:hypothetical protein